MIVKVNGVEYETHIVEGVQRFVADPAVATLVRQILTARTQGVAVEVPEGLDEHYNAVVRRMAERNSVEYYGLNELTVDLHRGKVIFEDWIEFSTLHGLSVCGFMDSVESQASNMGLDFTLEVENPLWED